VLPTLPPTGKAANRSLKRKTIEAARKEEVFQQEVVKTKQSRIGVTAFRGLVVEGRALDSSPQSSPSGPNRHRAPCGSLRVRIEARDESQKTTSNNKNKNAKEGKNKNTLTQSAVS
jgi:hypothetical protein